MEKYFYLKINKKCAMIMLPAIGLGVAVLIIAIALGMGRQQEGPATGTASAQEGGLGDQIAHDLISTVEYIERLHSSVNDNQGTLSLHYIENTKNNQNVLERYDALEMAVMALLDSLDSFILRQAISNAEMGSHVSAIRDSLSEARDELSKAHSEAIFAIGKAKTDISADLAGLQSALKSDLRGVSNKLADSSNAIMNLLIEMDKGQGDAFGDIASYFTELLNSLEALASGETLSIINSILTMSERLEHDSAEKFAAIISHLSEMGEEQDEKRLENASYFANALDELEALISTEALSAMESIQAANFEAQNFIGDKIADLSARLGILENEIILAKEEAFGLLGRLNDSSSLEMLNYFNALNASLSSVNDLHSQAYGEIMGLHADAALLAEENHTNLTDVLKIMASRMENDNMENFSAMLNYLRQVDQKLGRFDILSSEIGSVSDSISNFEDAANAQFGSLKGSVLGGIDSLEGSVDTVGGLIGSLGDSVLDGIGGVRSETATHFMSLADRINHFEAAVNSQLETLFTSVSNGKDLIAAALLTKGETVASDDSFMEMRNAILRIENGVYIGEVEHIYHYHVDSEDNVIGTNEHHSPGGCYNAAVFHAHVSACYGGAFTSHSHTDSCGRRDNFRCLYCNHQWSGPVGSSPNCPQGHGSYGYRVNTGYTCNSQPLNAARALSCGKGIDTVEHYGADCGFKDGQIVKAVITYPASPLVPQGQAVNFSAGIPVRHWHEHGEDGAELREPYVFFDTASTRKGGCFVITKIHIHDDSCHDQNGKKICGFERIIYYLPGCGYANGGLFPRAAGLE
ncbi:MAG: hypothetical protein FWG91_10250 [Lachnospiraceae bacterium]|nr:hypothetical protein [Lachnospiraceae bacterium]